LEQIVKREGNIRESFDLLKEALTERNYFLESAPFMNHPLKVVIPTKSFFWNTFWNFPGVIVYHLIYIWRSMFGTSKVAIKGPNLHLKGRMKKDFPKMKDAWANSVSFWECVITDSRMVLLSLLTSTIKNYHPG
jgi:glycerol-3-phosphate dehydrogenase